jgi:hypothetical protein
MAAAVREELVLHCADHSGNCVAIATLQENDRVLFRKIDQLNITAMALLITVIIDVLLRIYIHVPLSLPK